MALVTLVSGGLDSTLMSLMANEEGITLHPLFVNYGQLGSDREWTACQFLHKRHRLPKVTRMNISGFGRVIPSGITNSKLRINEDAFLPGRNLLLILAGAAHAYRVNASGVAMGLLNPNAHLFPDQTQDFLKQAEAMIKVSMGQHISVVTPLLGFTKRDVLEMVHARKLKGTYSCHSGREKPCGKCVSCLEINKAQEGK